MKFDETIRPKTAARYLQTCLNALVKAVLDLRGEPISDTEADEINNLIETGLALNHLIDKMSQTDRDIISHFIAEHPIIYPKFDAENRREFELLLVIANNESLMLGDAELYGGYDPNTDPLPRGLTNLWNAAYEGVVGAIKKFGREDTFDWAVGHYGSKEKMPRTLKAEFKSL
tara:strand:- start:79 stop:597 length:519 start_codon:yes stop_codon:yes gene_type:complete